MSDGQTKKYEKRSLESVNVNVYSWHLNYNSLYDGVNLWVFGSSFRHVDSEVRMPSRPETFLILYKNID